MDEQCMQPEKLLLAGFVGPGQALLVMVPRRMKDGFRK